MDFAQCTYCGSVILRAVYAWTKPIDPGVKKSRHPFCSRDCVKKWKAPTPSKKVIKRLGLEVQKRLPEVEKAFIVTPTDMTMFRITVVSGVRKIREVLALDVQLLDLQKRPVVAISLAPGNKLKYPVAISSHFRSTLTGTWQEASKGRRSRKRGT